MFILNQLGHISTTTPYDGSLTLQVSDLKRRPTFGWQDALRAGIEPRYVYVAEGRCTLVGQFMLPDGRVIEDERIVRASYQIDVPRDEQGNFGLSGLEKLEILVDKDGNAVLDTDGEPVLGVMPHPVESPISATPAKSEGKYTMEALPLADGTPVPSDCIELLINRDHSKALRLTGVTILPATRKVPVPGSLTEKTTTTVQDKFGAQCVNLWADDYEVVEAQRRCSAKGGFAPTINRGQVTRIPAHKVA